MIIMITGGQRSGKSLFAERLAMSLSGNPFYIATAQVFDEDFRHRVDVHKQRRGQQWTTFEEPLHVDGIRLTPENVVVFDCVTLWATNWFFECGEDGTRALDEMKKAFDVLVSSGAILIMVTNEIGLGGVAENAMQRRFTDLQGSINQHIASIADEVHFIVSGIDLKIK
ncbi:bifunctional adenosylcobinamide kinase/adenosylcobinamide-phosphate guanylyltransferase [uncultured Duncaniella sp.]|uniref:bifunctional adenosylcobinamide kinase/adenosylcobinamide-phosphate guanylyltransferase n=1 Tax=uncultured Duncaniella sp. TaxID=2768039 RepID=UPI0025CE211D|nr:bifunctional adenosylcobinamide kinase/adenosylcobinamide-phosphate guanylyltransferase [uncultured Duncaniella sp.]